MNPVTSAVSKVLSILEPSLLCVFAERNPPGTGDGCGAFLEFLGVNPNVQRSVYSVEVARVPHQPQVALSITLCGPHGSYERELVSPAAIRWHAIPEEARNVLTSIFHEVSLQLQGEPHSVRVYVLMPDEVVRTVLKSPEV